MSENNRWNPHDRTRLELDDAPPVSARYEEGARLKPEDIEKLHILRRVALESILGPLERCPIQLLETGEVLLVAGQTNQNLFMVLDGELSVHLEKPDSDPVAKLVSGQTVGEISVIDDSPASAHVVAASDSRLLVVNEDTFWRMVGASHEFAANMLLLLAERMRASNYAITENVKLRRRFERDAEVDGLTGLHNRRWLDNKLPRLVGRHERSGRPLTLLMCDVDYFKRFNDDYGHAAGDEVLVSVARNLMSKLRPMDLGARYGGEEFVVILADTDLDGAKVAAERLRRAVADTKVSTTDGRNLPPVTISIGLAQLKKDEKAAAMLARADAALYLAKRNGRNRIEV
ncbi:MAG: diguanylate cyclase [Proteobacteria bacterium]|nr:diguanylate cyclase [Pseudomonadota bacterium]